MTKHKCSQKFPGKKVQATNNKKTKEKALVENYKKIKEKIFRKK